MIVRFFISLGWSLIAVTLLSGALRAAELPGQRIDLTHWKLTLPVASDGSKQARELRAPELAMFHDPSCFFVDSQRQAIVFRAPCGGATTKGSKYPRCELRELYGTGKESSAVWSTDDTTTHALDAMLAITHLPERKNQVVCAQIHDAKDDLLMIRLEGRKLFIERNKSGDVLLDADYQLGTFFDLNIRAGQGRVQVAYNGERKLDWEQSRRGCYFKIGCYTQSNVERGDAPDAYGEVAVRKLSLTPAGK